MSDAVSPLPPACYEANAAAALFDGAAYDAMPDLLRRARCSIRLTFFLFGGPVADAMMDALAERQSQGVAVRVLLDRSIGWEGLLPGIVWECRRAFRRLQKLGIETRLSDPVPLPNWPGKKPLSHHKFLVIDDQEALVGGMNVGTLFRRYHDLMIHLTGPTARALSRQFDADWRYASEFGLPRPEGSASLSEELPPASSSNGSTYARLLGTGIGRCTTEAALRQNLRRAEKSVQVAVCEMGRTALLDDLIACHRRSVAVRVLLCPLKISPFLPLGILNAGAVETLTRAGIPVHFYRLGPDCLRMHLKLAIFDGGSAVAGSTNWTRSGFGWIGETDVELHGGDVLAQLTAQFEADWRRSAPTSLPSPSAKRLHALYERLTQ
ncbi:MAG: phosphatidylserine/phosphatidylglycerophosphate/cardiolipin synthase family protein [Armatimonadota bacterium]|nr:phosphatidylserine/phosphatidylglycerophosphate/cardiolipin synthase family protein [Armatimonadota bacterium]